MHPCSVILRNSQNISILLPYSDLVIKFPFSIPSRELSQRSWYFYEYLFMFLY